MVDLTPDLEPIGKGAAFDDYERELFDLFRTVFRTQLRDSERALNVYGVPHLGSADLIERNVKQDGLALLHRDDEPALRYLFLAWRTRNPRRGLHFLRTYLQLLYSNGWIAEQQWQRKDTPYPLGLATPREIAGDPQDDHYLTSRVAVLIGSDDEDGTGLPQIAPALRSVVAAKYVLDIRLHREFDNRAAVLIGSMCVPYAVVSFEGEAELTAPAVGAIEVTLANTLVISNFVDFNWTL